MLACRPQCPYLPLGTAPTPLAPSPHAAAPDELAGVLRARGLRLTAPRQMVLEAVYGLGHATPDQIHAEVAKRAAGVNITTVYRTLELLEELGLVSHALAVRPVTKKPAKAA